MNKKRLSLDDYKKTTFIHRKDILYSPIDSNIHFKGYGNQSLPFETIIKWLIETNILFCTITGLGQSLPFDSACQYYLNCPNEKVKNTILKDLQIGMDLNKYYQKYKNQIIILFAASFVDLNKPEKSVDYIKLLNHLFDPNIKSIGETNVCKPILKFNDYHCIDPKIIPKWKDLMFYLEKHQIPILLHCDLGDKENPTKYLYLMKNICSTYPNNKIIWPHMGISKESYTIHTDLHLQIMKELLQTYPHLYIDLTWTVLYDLLFKNNPEKCKKYASFFNQYSKRFLPGTDFVASSNKTFDNYLNELHQTSYIYKYIDNHAFRNIVLGQNYIDLYKLPYQAPYLE